MHQVITAGTVSNFVGPTPVGVADGEGGAHLVVEVAASQGAKRATTKIAALR